MKVVILAGGYGTRISEETSVRPKPMVAINGQPILWHIMKIYGYYGFNDFVICCGYKGYVIKDYFVNYALRNSDVTVDLSTNKVKLYNNSTEPWNVTMIDTGDGTMTGGRLKRVQHLLNDEPFFLTYGDGVSDIDIKASLEFHRDHGLLATMTAVQPPGRFGTFRLEDGQTRVRRFREKPMQDDAWINGGFFVLDPGVIEYIDDDDTVWEQKPLERLARDQQLAAYRHNGFWHPMDTLRDKNVLEDMWNGDDTPWKIW